MVLDSTLHSVGEIWLLEFDAMEGEKTGPPRKGRGPESFLMVSVS